MKPRTPIRRVSEKKLQANAGKMWSTISSAPKKHVKKKPRSKSERERIYGPPGYVEWIHEQPCVACGWVMGSECAHIASGGVGRKDDWTRTVPLCGAKVYRKTYGDEQGVMMGCHGRLHHFGRQTFENNYHINLVELAAATRSRWLAAHPKKEQK